MGGALCLIGQQLIDRTKLTPGADSGGLRGGRRHLTAVGLYGPLVEWAGAGATVPLSGFGYLLATGVEEGIREHGLLGALTGPFTAAAGGVMAAILFGLLAGLVGKSHDKS